MAAGSSPDAGPGQAGAVRGRGPRWLAGPGNALAPLPIRDTRLTRWRLRSRACAVADVLGAAAGVSLYLIAGIDSVASWPSNQVLLSDGDLSRLAGALLFPWWLWLIASAGMIIGWDNRGRSRSRRWRPPSPMRSPEDTVPPPVLATAAIRWPAWAWACLAAAAVVSVAIVAGGFAVGAAKGSVRVLPGPRYLVSTLDLNQAAWTTVTAGAFQRWQASFVREDGLFMFFGLFATAGFIGLLWLRRQAVPAGSG